jgi:hypothetical protein
MAAGGEPLATSKAEMMNPVSLRATLERVRLVFPGVADEGKLGVNKIFLTYPSPIILVKPLPETDVMDVLRFWTAVVEFRRVGRFGMIVSRFVCRG